MRSLGLDIGGTSIKLALIEPGRPAVLRRAAATYADPTQDDLARHLADILRDLPTPDHVGLCLPGLFDPATRTLAASVNLPRLAGTRPDDLLARAHASLPRALIAPDALAAATDFHALHPAQGRLLALSLGTGIGACVLDDVVPLRVSAPGAPFSSGHLGHMDVAAGDPEPPRAHDGSVGTLEAYLGSPALRRRFNLPDHADIPPLAAGDPSVRALVRALRIAHAVYRPHRLALLGGVSFALAPLADHLRAATADGLTTLARPGWTLAFADDTFHAARGVARLAATTDAAANPTA
jgi:predicted NBD/HSP70 family sugar kinase